MQQAAASRLIHQVDVTRSVELLPGSLAIKPQQYVLGVVYILARKASDAASHRPWDRRSKFVAKALLKTVSDNWGMSRLPAPVLAWGSASLVRSSQHTLSGPTRAHCHRSAL